VKSVLLMKRKEEEKGKKVIVMKLEKFTVTS
jgi:hypothetical protein